MTTQSNGTSMVPENSSSPDWMSSQCNSIEHFLQEKPISIAFHAHLVLLGGTLVGIALLAQQYRRQKLCIHPNLLILFVNIIFLHLFYVLSVFALLFRYRLLLTFYKHPCELLTPLWMVPILLGPNYVYVVAFPVFHFCIMLERVRATFMADKYEREGTTLCIALTILIWTISIGFMAYVIVVAFSADIDAPSPPYQGIITLTNKRNNPVILYVNAFNLLLVILTPLGDWWIAAINREAKKNSQTNFAHYSLSRNYQLTENGLTLRLILPLDIAYACLYSIYQIFVIILRANHSTILPYDYAYHVFLINSIFYVYIAIAIIVYIQFVRFRGRKRTFHGNKISSKQNDETNLYFQQLQSQWA